MSFKQIIQDKTQNFLPIGRWGKTTPNELCPEFKFPVLVLFQILGELRFPWPETGAWIPISCKRAFLGPKTQFPAVPQAGTGNFHTKIFHFPCAPLQEKRDFLDRNSLFQERGEEGVYWSAANGSVTSGGLRGVWPPLLEVGRNRPFSPFSAFFRPFPEGPNSTWKI